jgi:putative CGCGG family rSAM target protein
MFGAIGVRPRVGDERMSTDAEEIHENSWSANLEGPEHAANPDLVVEQAVEAVERTADGYHVNLVTHGDLGHPEEYLFAALAEAFEDRTLCWEYVEQCGCGGYVTRVYVGSETPPR